MLDKFKKYIGLLSNQSATTMQTSTFNNLPGINLQQTNTGLGTINLNQIQPQHLDGIKITLYTANGGIILQVSDTDRDNGFPKHQLYVISDNEEDIPGKLGKILFLEIMKR